MQKSVFAEFYIYTERPAVKMPVLFDWSGQLGKPGSETNRFWCGEGSKCPWVNGERGRRCGLMHSPQPQEWQEVKLIIYIFCATIVFRVFKVTINNMNQEFNSLGGRMGVNSREDEELRVMMMMMRMMIMRAIDNCH